MVAIAVVGGVLIFVFAHGFFASQEEEQEDSCPSCMKWYNENPVNSAEWNLTATKTWIGYDLANNNTEIYYAYEYDYGNGTRQIVKEELRAKLLEAKEYDNIIKINYLLPAGLDSDADMRFCETVMSDDAIESWKARFYNTVSKYLEQGFTMAEPTEKDHLALRNLGCWYEFEVILQRTVPLQPTTPAQ